MNSVLPSKLKGEIRHTENSSEINAEDGFPGAGESKGASFVDEHEQ
jgi:hypothetical protein